MIGQILLYATFCSFVKIICFHPRDSSGFLLCYLPQFFFYLRSPTYVFLCINRTACRNRCAV